MPTTSPAAVTALAGLVEQRGDAEVDELDAAGTDDDVGRLDVAVHDAGGVGGAEGGEHRDRDRPPPRTPASGPVVRQPLSERLSAHPLHHEVQEAVRLAGVVDGDGVGVD